MNDIYCSPDNTPLRIAYCHNEYQLRSGEDIAKDYAVDLLRDAGHEVTTYTRNNLEIRTFGLSAKLAFPFHTTYSSRTQRDLTALVHARNPQVAIVQNVFPLISPSAYKTFAEANVPVVQLLFNYRLLCVNGLFFTNGAICERCAGGNYSHAVLRRCFKESYTLSAVYAASLAFHRMARTWERYVTLFVSPDEFLKDKLVSAGFDRERIRVIANPFDSTKYEPSYAPGTYALFVGRVIRPKGIFTLLDAVDANESLNVMIAGDGEDADEARRHPVVSSGRATMAGAVYGDALERLLADSACVVVPSEWYDNLPMIICQAFAHGKPVIASRIDGIPEFVCHEENGLLFTPGSASELADAIKRLCGNRSLCERLGRGARKTAERVLSPRVWQANINNTLWTAVKMGSPRRSNG